MNETQAPRLDFDFKTAKVPESRATNIFEFASFLLSTGGLITTKKNYPAATIDQTLPIRADRAQRYQEAIELRERPFEERQIAYKPHANDHMAKSRIEREFLNVEAIRAESGADILSTYTVLNHEQINSDNPPLFVISGASNGIESMDSFTRQLAFIDQNRPIIVMAYPEAATEGDVDEAFFQSVLNDNGVTPHADVFSAMINHISASLGINQPIDILGYSAGAMIATELMGREEIQQKVRRAIFVCPGGTYLQTDKQFMAGLGKETNTILKMAVKGRQSIQNLIRYSFFNDFNKDQQKQLRFGIWRELGKRAATDFIHQRISSISNIDKKIVIISGGSDEVTKSAIGFPEGQTSSINGLDLKSIVLPNELHAGPFIHPEVFAETVKTALNESTRNNN